MEGLKDKKQRLILRQEFLSKAKENLKIAHISFEQECYNACANRAYFAAFQAAIAALADKGVQNRKNDHAWVQSEFNRRLIKNRKVYPDKMKTYLLNMQDVRNHADYSVEKIGKNLARRQLGRADEMVESIEKELSK